MVDGKCVVIDGKLGIFLESLTKETDRGLAILSGVIIEERLGLLLTEILVQGKESDELIKRNLGGLEARSKAAFCVGAISRRELRLIDFIRKIRNHFAHQFVTDEFDGTFESLKGQIYSAGEEFIPNLGENFKESTREVYSSLVLSVIVGLWERQLDFGKGDYIEERE